MGGALSSQLIDAAKTDPASLRHADPKLTDAWGWSLMHYAAQANRADFVRALAATPGAPINETSGLSLVTSSYITPLQVAARERAESSLRALLALPGIQVNLVSNGRSALHWACDAAPRGDRPDIVEALLDAGADADAPAQLGIIPLGVAGSSRTSAAVLALNAGYELSLNAVLRRSSPLVVADALVRAARATTRPGSSGAADATRRRLLAVVLRSPTTSPGVIEDAVTTLTVDLARARARLEVLRAEAAEMARLAAGADADGPRGTELSAAVAAKRHAIDAKTRESDSLADVIAILRASGLPTAPAAAAAAASGGAAATAAAAPQPPHAPAAAGSSGAAAASPWASAAAGAATVAASLAASALNSWLWSAGGADSAGGGRAGTPAPPAPPAAASAAPPPQPGRGAGPSEGAPAVVFPAAPRATGGAVPSAPPPDPRAHTAAAGAGAWEGGGGERQCPVCMDAARDAALVPCGHTLCAGCAALVRPTACPVCRRRIESVLRLY